MMRNIQKVDDDIIEMKRLIKQKLISDTDILEALHNTDIDIDSPDEFLDNNIYGFIRIPQTQDTVRNFICFTVDDVEDHHQDRHAGFHRGQEIVSRSQRRGGKHHHHDEIDPKTRPKQPTLFLIHSFPSHKRGTKPIVSVS